MKRRDSHTCERTWCGDHAMALTAAEWSLYLYIGRVELTSHIRRRLSLPARVNDSVRPLRSAWSGSAEAGWCAGGVYLLRQGIGCRETTADRTPPVGVRSACSRVVPAPARPC
jgi:hypothetical protein